MATAATGIDEIVAIAVRQHLSQQLSIGINVETDRTSGASACCAHPAMRRAAISSTRPRSAAARIGRRNQARPQRDALPDRGDRKAFVGAAARK
jgi:hypothetical protein